MKHEHEQLASGKAIIRMFDDAGHLYHEQHYYGGIDIAFSITYRNGAKEGETYMVRNRIVSRARYEKARLDFSDMPAADTAGEDGWGNLLKQASKERRKRSEEAKTHKPNREEADKIDKFCEELMQRGKKENALTWIQAHGNTLGEYSHTKSRNLVNGLKQIGCAQVYACNIDIYEDGAQNTGHLVVELPEAGAVRRIVLGQIDKLARLQGYSGDTDDGQRYSYIKLA